MKEISIVFMGARRAIFLTMLALCTLASAPSNAQEQEWKYAAEAYLWGANVDIETEAGTDTEIRFTDIVDDLQLGGMLALFAHHDKWMFGLDGLYLDIDDNVEEVVQEGVELNDLKLEAWVVSPMVGYELLQSDRFSLFVMAGARYLWIDVSEKINFSPPEPVGTENFSTSDGSWDGLIGIRGHWRLSDDWYTTYHLDVGTGDSGLTWQALGAFGYRFNRFDAIVGYRYLEWDNTENDALEDLNMSGVMAGVKFWF